MKCGDRYEKLQDKLSSYCGDTIDPKYCKVKINVSSLQNVFEGVYKGYFSTSEIYSLINCMVSL